MLELFVRVEDYLIQRRGFRFTLFIVLELFLLALPGVAREHTQGVIVKGQVEVAGLYRAEDFKVRFVGVAVIPEA